ncbi:MAG: hypothetical protein K2P73_06395 [Lachnospiraceae bacterium]|nr:hypothetical protein [Lachnospiraceae bacterium]
MMTDNELLLAISNAVQSQIEPLKHDIRDVKLLLENDVLPRLNTIESCYTSTYRRYASGINQLEALQSDVDIIKKVVAEHSEKLQKIS